MSTDREQRASDKRSLMLALTCIKDSAIGLEMIELLKSGMEEEDIALIERIVRERYS